MSAKTFILLDDNEWADSPIVIIADTAEAALDEAISEGSLWVDQEETTKVTVLEAKVNPQEFVLSSGIVYNKVKR